MTIRFKMPWLLLVQIRIQYAANNFSSKVNIKDAYIDDDDMLPPAFVTDCLRRSTWNPIVILFTNPSARAGYDTRSIFKRSLTGLNSEFSFS